MRNEDWSHRLIVILGVFFFVGSTLWFVYQFLENKWDNTEDWTCLEYENRTQKALCPVGGATCGVLDDGKVAVICNAEFTNDQWEIRPRFDRPIVCPKMATQDIASSVCVREGLNCREVFDRMEICAGGFGCIVKEDRHIPLYCKDFDCKITERIKTVCDDYR